MPKLLLSPYKRHVATWSNCQDCFLHERRSHVVLARGQLPCDILLVGEAPGVSEDTLAQPFIGPAGKLLDQMIAEASEMCEVEPRLAFTNIIGCIPLVEITVTDNPEMGHTTKVVKLKEPPKESIRACKPRLQEIIGIAKPQVIIQVGKIAEKHTPNIVRNCEFMSIIHPAAILRMDSSQKGLVVQRTVITLADAMELIE